MKIENLELSTSLPRLKKTHVIAILRPYLNAKDVSTLIFDKLKNYYNAEKLGQLKNPGNFYDFTRYRPQTYLENEKRKMKIPNTSIYCSSSESNQDFIFLNLLEPHYQGEKYVDIITEILNKFNVKRYCLLGSMNNTVPHTKPLLVSGDAPEYILKNKELDIQKSDYEGPSSIIFSLNYQNRIKSEVELMYFLVSVPQYLQYFKFNTGFIPGKLRLLKILHELYNIPIHNLEKKRAENQLKKIDDKLEENSNLKPLVDYFEKIYKKKKNEIPLSPEIEKTIKNMEEKWEDKGMD
ncbi:MAG: PAC2 family protein [Bacillota bacterium]